MNNFEPKLCSINIFCEVCDYPPKLLPVYFTINSPIHPNHVQSIFNHGQAHIPAFQHLHEHRTRGAENQIKVYTSEQFTRHIRIQLYSKRFALHLRPSLRTGEKTCFAKYWRVQSEGMVKLTRHIHETEKKILAYQDKNIVDIFWKSQRSSEKICKYFLAYGYWTLVVFYIYPVYHAITTPREELVDDSGNETIYFERPTLFSGDFPFDKNKYYWYVFVFQVWGGMFTASFTNISDIFFYATMMFGAMHIKVLQYRLKHFRLLSLKEVETSAPKEKVERKIFLYLEDCIREHRIIIQYITDLDNCLKYLMLVDSILSTIQISLIGLGCLLSGFTLKQINTLEFLTWNIGQLFFFYYCANEILIAGLDLPHSMWASEWVNCSQNIKKMLLFMMRRAGRPLAMNVGPFYQMAIPSMLNILKTAASYFAVMRQMIGK